ncbi:MAG: alpha/beta hydrolase [Actinomycetales bacterium]|nr:MAG: alpha/beta hydrolase [Actinomycetales bacterium]
MLLIISLAGAGLAAGAERGFGRIQVDEISFMTNQNVPMSAKVFRPVWVDENNPAPGLLALHGYQSDKEATTTFGAIELARRGFVVVSIDQFGMGYSTQHPVDFEIMSGAAEGLKYLKSLPFVDNTKLGTFGHSTGSIYALKLAAANPDVGAIVALSGNGGDPDVLKVKNYLLVQGDAEEIGGYREKTFPVSDLVKNPARLAAFGLSDGDTIKWNHTYGSFTDGTARRVELVSGTHLGVMVGGDSNTAVVSWFNDALRAGKTDSHWINPTSHIYQWKEIGGGIALIALVITLVPLTSLLLQLPLLGKAIGSEGSWQGPKTRGLVIFAVVNIILTMLLYPLFTQKGGGKDPISANVDFLPLQMGNGIATWLLATVIITAILFALWWLRGGGQKLKWSEIGVLAKQDSKTWIASGLLLSGLLIGWLAVIVSLTAFFRGPQYRVLWPMLKTLTPERVYVLLPYFLIIWIFFFVVNGLAINGMARLVAKDNESDLKLFARRSAFAILAAVGGLVLLWLFHFVPDYLGVGPGMDVIGLPTLGGRWMMMLFVIIPQFIGLILLNTWLQIRTRSIWVSTTVAAAIFTWFVVGGQVGVF